jgi:hypothetical protein
MHTPGKTIAVLISVLLLQACDQPRFNLDVIIIPREVQNFEEVNSIYDDYNSAGPPIVTISDVFSLLFSSNRNSNGANFDLVFYSCWITTNQVDGLFKIVADPEDFPLIDTINSGFNEWGPYLTIDMLQQHYLEQTMQDTARVFFSSDRTGNQDIYYWHFHSIDDPPKPMATTGGINELNTMYDEGYLCLHPAALPDRETGYFTSNRGGTFDIYRAVGEASRRIETSDSLQISKMEILSSNSDDKCPYIVNNTMVFTSNRDGGYGGYDLWYSVFEAGGWSTPVNFGPAINTQYDEYRPIIIPTQPELVLNDMLIFSSNRPGGKGGFDLYYTGLKRRGENLSE